jgi:cytochrome P450
MPTTTLADTITVADLDRDPYPLYRELRDRAPVAWVPVAGLWMVTRWDDVQAVTLDHERFTADIPGPLNRTLGRNMMHAPRDYHRRLRAMIEPLLRPAAIKRHADETIPRLAHELIDAFRDRGAAEIIAEFAEPLSVRMLKHVLGMSEVPDDNLRAWFNAIALGVANFEADPAKQALADRASAELHDAVTPILDRLRRHPDDSVLSRMLAAEFDGHRLSREEIDGNLKLMMIGGMQEPRDVVGLALWALLTHPDQYALLLSEPTLVRKAIEETLRWASPVGTLTRLTTAPTTLADVDLPAGARLGAIIASANRDERHWRDPDRFDLARDDLGHLAFGAGDHFCVGAWLGRATCRVALRLLLDRLPNLRLTPAHAVTLHGWEFRGVTQLHLRWDA